MTTPTGWARVRGGPDGGSVAVLVCFIVVIAGTLVAGVVDAGAQVQAATQADTFSSEAARAAGIAVGPVPHGDGPDTARATAAARDYLARAGATGTVTIVGPATVQVTVTVTTLTPILGVQVTQTRDHTAQLQVGVQRGEGVP